MRYAISTSNAQGAMLIADYSGLDLLVSYGYEGVFKGAHETLKSKGQTQFADSGVVQARKYDMVITPDDLIKFYYEYEDIIEYIFGLDIGTPKEQFDKTMAMHKAGVPVIPIYHADMGFKLFDKMAEMRDYVAVSFYKVKQESASRLKFCQDVFRHIKKTRKDITDIKVHGLGIEVPQVCSRVPFYSIDCSSAENIIRFGNMSIYDEKTLTFKGFRNKDSIDQIKDNAGKIGPVCLNVQSRDPKKRPDVRCFAFAQREKFRKHMTDIWSNRGISWED